MIVQLSERVRDFSHLPPLLRERHSVMCCGRPWPRLGPCLVPDLCSLDKERNSMHIVFQPRPGPWFVSHSVSGQTGHTWPWSYCLGQWRTAASDREALAVIVAAVAAACVDTGALEGCIL